MDHDTSYNQEMIPDGMIDHHVIKKGWKSHYLMYGMALHDNFLDVNCYPTHYDCYSNRVDFHKYCKNAWTYSNRFVIMLRHGILHLMEVLMLIYSWMMTMMTIVTMIRSRMRIVPRPFAMPPAAITGDFESEWLPEFGGSVYAPGTCVPPLML